MMRKAFNYVLADDFAKYSASCQGYNQSKNSHIKHVEKVKLLCIHRYIALFHALDIQLPCMKHSVIWLYQMGTQSEWIGA